MNRMTKILVPVDFTPCSDEAVRFAADRAHRYDTSLGHTIHSRSFLRGPHRWIAAVAISVACSSAGPPPAEHANRASSAWTQAGIPCRFVALEAEQGPGDENSDAVTLFAVYRFSERDVAAPKQPLSLVFRVKRSRVRELQDHLASQPQVLCVPDADSGYRAQVAPFGFSASRAVH
jgi:hypothetical protein